MDNLQFVIKGEYTEQTNISTLRLRDFRASESLKNNLATLTWNGAVLFGDLKEVSND